MNAPPFFYQSGLSFSMSALSTPVRIVFTLLCLTTLSACKGMLSDQSDKASSTRRLRIKVGQIKEIKLSLPKDSTLLVVGSTDNEEIVDVSRREVGYAENANVKPEPARSSIFLIKGVTNGKAKVIFAEKRVEEQGPGRMLKTYTVEVVTK